MGLGVELARAAGGAEHAAVIDNLKDQLLIVFLKRLQAKGESLRFPVREVNDTGQDTLSFRIDIDSQEFVFELGKKS